MNEREGGNREENTRRSESEDRRKLFTVARMQFSHPRVDLRSSVRELRSFHFLFRAVFRILLDLERIVVSPVVRVSALRVIRRFRGAVIVVVMVVVVVVSRWTGAHLPHAATAAVAVTEAGRSLSLARVDFVGAVVDFCEGGRRLIRVLQSET